jgi:hypothetical protein
MHPDTAMQRTGQDIVSFLSERALVFWAELSPKFPCRRQDCATELHHSAQ